MWAFIAFKVDWASNVKFLIKGTWSLAFGQMIVDMVKTQTDFNVTRNFRLKLSLLLKFAFSGLFMELCFRIKLYPGF